MTALTCVAVFLAALPAPLSNIDDHELRTFAGGLFPTIARVWSNDLVGTGRFRPLYWIFEGGLAVVTGNGGTVLHVGRAAFLLVAVVLQVRTALKLGATVATACAAALLVNWSYPGIDVWVPGGPSEAFAQPLAIGAICVLLSAPTGRRISLAAALGLAACLAKETYAAWTGAALAAVALHCVARGSLRWRALIAALGAAAQFLPAAIAWLGSARRSGSYARYVLTSLSGTPADAAITLLLKSPVLALLGTVGLVAVLSRLVRTRPTEWDVRDLVVAAGAIGTAGLTVGLGLLTSRYHLALVTALALVAARAWSGVVCERSRAAALVAATVAVCVIGGAGARAGFAAWWGKTRCASEQRFRAQLAAAFREHGAARVRWPPPTIEQVLGAVHHLDAEGVVGQLQIEPCQDHGIPMAPLLRDYLAPYERRIVGPAPLLVATACFERSAPRCDPGWLPHLERGWPVHLCGPAAVMARAAQDLAVVAPSISAPAPRATSPLRSP